MRYLDRLSLGLGRKVPVILQTESSECGLACLAMIAGYYGYESDLLTLRQKYPISQKEQRLQLWLRLPISCTSRPDL